MKPQIPQSVNSSVNAYLLARVHAEIMREKVDEIGRQILKECPLTNDLELKYGQPEREITEPKYVYLCTDQDALKDYYAECNRREREAGIKPSDMPDDHCPACVAEHLQTITEHLLIDSTAEILGEKDDFRHRLLCSGLEKYHQFIDLTVKMVVSMPGFKNPLTRQPV